jgi:hypothetical protein
MSNKTILLAFIGLLMIGSSLSQGCFKKKFESAAALKGDTVALDLDKHAKGNNLTFKIASTEEGHSIHTLKKTFERVVSTSELSPVAEDCTYVAEGPVEGELFLICDKIKIVKAVLDKSNGKIKTLTSASVNAAWEIKSLQLAAESSVGYALCADGNDLQLLKFSTVQFEEPLPNATKITQGTKERITGDIRLVLDEGKKAGDSNNFLFIYEHNINGVDVKFRGYRENDKGTMTSLGFFDFSAEVDKIQGIDKTTPKKLYSIVPNGESIYFVLKEEKTEEPKATRNLAYKCNRSMTNSKLICTGNAFITEGNDHIKIYQGERTSGKSLQFFKVSNTEVVQVGLVPADMTTYELFKLSLEGHKLKSISDFWKSGKNYYITGTTDVEGTDRPSLLKINTNYNFFEEVPEYSLTPGLAYVRKDFYDDEYARWFQFSKGSMKAELIQENVLIINTTSFDAKKKSITYTITCTALDKNRAEVTESQTFKIDTMLEVNSEDEIIFSPPSEVSAYQGSNVVQLPTNGNDIKGNAISVKAKDLPEGWTFTADLMEEREVNYIGSKIVDINDLRYIDGNLYAVVSETQVDFVRCIIGFMGKFDCKNVIPLVSLPSGFSFFEAKALKNTIVLLTGNKTTGVASLEVFSTYSQKSLAKKTQTIWMSAGELVVNQNEVRGIAIGSDKKDGKSSIFTVSFNVAKLTTVPIPEWTSVLPVDAHICPIDIERGPLDSPYTYISSNCKGDELDRHIYVFNINFAYLSGAALVDTYTISESEKFSVCPQNRLVNVVDYTSNKIYAHDNETNSFTKLYYPFSQYGLTKIVSHSCDENEGILQVLATDAAGLKRWVVTYKANQALIPFGRVHSVVEVGSKLNFLASSFNYENDDSLTLLLGSTTEDNRIFELEVDGPHMKFSMANSEINGTKDITLEVTFKGSKDKDLVLTPKLKLNVVPQKTDLTLTSKDPISEPLKGPVNLDKKAIIEGPYYKAGAVSAGVTVNDRMTESTQFNWLATSLNDSCMDGELVFGYKTDDKGLHTIHVLSKEKKDDPELTVEGLKVKAFKCIRSGEKTYFMAHVSSDKLLEAVFLAYKDGDKWAFQTAEVTDTHDGLEKVRFISLEGNKEPTFVISGTCNKFGYQIISRAFTLSSNALKLGPIFEDRFTDFIADFEVVPLSTKDFVIIVGVQFTSEADFFWVQLDEALGVTMKNKSKSTLVPNVKETHQDIVFDCIPIKDEAKFECVHSGKNMHSYHVVYEYSLKEDETFIKFAKVQSLLKNVVNLTPIKVDMVSTNVSSYVAFTVRNENSNANAKNFLFPEQYLVVVYDLKANPKSVQFNKAEASSIDVYKLLDAASLGVLPSDNLKNLDPRFFLTTDNQVKLGINVGTAQKSAKVFNLDPLRLVFEDVALVHTASDLKLVGIDKKPTSIVLKTLFTITNTEKKKDEKPPGKSSALYFIIICSMAIVAVLIAVALIMSSKKGAATTEDDAIDDVERTMKAQDDESGSYHLAKN